jgi:hypothetical protein
LKGNLDFYRERSDTGVALAIKHTYLGWQLSLKPHSLLYLLSSAVTKTRESKLMVQTGNCQGVDIPAWCP